MPGPRDMMGPDPEAMGIFTGFNIKYPEYNVVLPQSGQSFSVRSLTVSEVARLKTSSTTPSKSTDLINRVLWEAIVDKPKEYKSFDDFMKGITLKDREALIYALYVTTFGEDREFNVICTSCGAERALKIKISELFSINAYPASDAMVKTYEVEKESEDLEPDPEMEEHSQKRRTTKKKTEVEPLPATSTPLGLEEDEEEEKVVETKGKKAVSDILVAEIPVYLPISKVVAYIHQPKLMDEYEILNEISFAKKKEVDLVNETLIIKRFEVLEDDGKNVKLTIREREDILRGYQSLPNMDRRAISDTYVEKFADYGIQLKSKWDCFECEAENELELDIVGQFFRMVARS